MLRWRDKMFLKTFAEYPARKRVGIVAILLGIISIFAGSPFDKSTTKINTKELSLISAEEIGKFDVEQLADDIIKSKYNYRLIDLRSSEEYLKYNIPTSENIKVSEILESDLSRNVNILLYSDSDIESTQAWFILKSNEYKGVNVLKGGLQAWQTNILFPSCSCGETPTIEQQHEHNKLAEISKFFGGKLQTESVTENIPQMEMPTIEAPKNVTLKKTAGKRKREGC
jgi:rhodanese-related sulfurtransferase